MWLREWILLVFFGCVNINLPFDFGCVNESYLLFWLCEWILLVIVWMNLTCDFGCVNESNLWFWLCEWILLVILVVWTNLTCDCVNESYMFFFDVWMNLTCFFWMCQWILLVFFWLYEQILLVLFGCANNSTTHSSFKLIKKVWQEVAFTHYVCQHFLSEGESELLQLTLLKVL